MDVITHQCCVIRLAHGRNYQFFHTDAQVSSLSSEQDPIAPSQRFYTARKIRHLPAPILADHR